MKRNLYIILTGIVVIIILMLIGNVITIGNQLAPVHPSLPYAFYAFVVLVFACFILIPVIRVLQMPAIPPLDVENNSDKNNKELLDFGTRIVKSSQTIPEEEKYAILREMQNNSAERDRLISTISEVIEVKLSDINKTVRESAVTVFVITGLSQNGTFDFLANLMINFRMIYAVVKKSGFKPSYSQLIKLYVASISSALIISQVDDIVDELDLDMGIANLSGSVLSIFSKSLISGAVNAYLTLRIGYAAREYIRVGSQNFKRSIVRKEARKYARKEIMSVATEGVSLVKEKMSKRSS